MRRTVDLVVADMAGTTVLDEGQVPAAFTAALDAHGVAVTPAAIEALRGASKRDAIAALLPPAADHARRTDLVYARFRTELERVFAAGVREVPGARQVFDTLRAAGIRVALNTGFDRDTAALLLRALHWDDGVVDAVVCGDDVTRGRPAPDLILACMAATGITDPSRVAVVGDTALDLQAGQAAGAAYVVGVLTGAHGRDRLAREPYARLLDAITELPALLGL